MSKGCHGTIQKIEGNLVLKTIKLDLNFFQKIFLYFRSLFCEKYPLKEANYIKSYRIEQNFYSNNSKSELGIFLPKIKSLNVNYKLEYSILMEDLSLFISNNRDMDLFISIIKDIAKFHMKFWNRKINYEVWKNGGYWTGNKRENDKNKFYKKYEIAIKNLINITNLKYEDFNAIKINIEKIKEYYEDFETLIHGDLKIENLFLSKNGLYLIDWQWVGYGKCATDIMYLLFTSLPSNLLNKENLEILLKEYCSINKNVNFDKIYKDFKIASLDFFIYLICCKWYNITIEAINKNEFEKNDGLHIRNVNQIESIIKLISEICLEDF